MARAVVASRHLQGRREALWTQAAWRSGRLLHHFAPKAKRLFLVVTTMTSGNGAAGWVVEIRDAGVQVEESLSSSS